MGLTGILAQSALSQVKGRQEPEPEPKLLSLLASEKSLVLEASIIYYFCLCLKKGGKIMEYQRK